MDHDAAVAGAALDSLGDQFRAILRGGESDQLEHGRAWHVDTLGEFADVVHTPAGSPRPDALARARIVLRRAVDAYEPTPPRREIRRNDARDLRRQLTRQHWGLDAYPSPTGPREIVRVGSAVGDGWRTPWVSLTDDPDFLEVEAVPAGSLPTRSARSRAAQHVTRNDRALAAARAPLDLAEPELEEDAAAVWRLGSAGRLADWPPLDTGERGWFLERLIERRVFADGQPAGPLRLNGTELEEAGRRSVRFLRAHAFDLHRAYIARSPETYRQRQHLDRVIRLHWFGDDAQVLDGQLPVLAPATTLTPQQKAHRRLLRSQAAIAQMICYGIVHEWQDEAMVDVLAERAASQLVFSRTLFSRDGAMFDGRSLQIRGRIAEVVNAPRKNLVEVGAFRLTPSELSLDRLRELRAIIDTGGAREGVEEYIRVRHRIGEDEWPALSVPDRRAVFFADHAVHLKAADLDDPALLDRLDDQLRQSASAFPFYAAFVGRDRAIAVSKAYSLSAYSRALGTLFRALSMVGSQRRAQEDDADRRRAVETQQQLILLITGTTAKIVELCLCASGASGVTVAEAVMTRRVAAALRWSAIATAHVTVMDEEGWLPAERYIDGYLATEGFRVQTATMRHRALVAALLAVRAFDLPWPTTDETLRQSRPTDADVDAALCALLSLTTIGPGSIPTIRQQIVAHALLRGGTLPVVDYAPAVAALPWLDETPDAAPATARAIAVDRLDDATAENLARTYDMGLVQRVPRASPTWRALQDHSHGMFARWREGLDARLQEDGRAPRACRSCTRAVFRQASGRSRCPNCGYPLP